jgi:hypothetical protein
MNTPFLDTIFPVITPENLSGGEGKNCKKKLATVGCQKGEDFHLWHLSCKRLVLDVFTPD